MGIGLLFLGGGRFSLGTSNAAIAAMVAAFYPRFPSNSADNKSHLPALRHLWVLAVEPRCLITRDVDTREVLHLPIKVKTKKGDKIEETQHITPALLSSADKVMYVKIDNPRYWPTAVNVQEVPNSVQTLIRNRPIFAQRRTNFLSYNEDPKGTRSAFTRTFTSTGDAANLHFPRLHTKTKIHPAADVPHFISSPSTHPFFVGFADRFCREGGYTEAEKTFHKFCHSVLMDCIMQDKATAITLHLALYQVRTMSHRNRNFYLRLHDLHFMNEFYSRAYVRKLSGRFDAPNSGSSRSRFPLMQEQIVRGAWQDLDDRLNEIRQAPRFQRALLAYLEGKNSGWMEDGPIAVMGSNSRPEWWYEGVERDLAWYMLRESVPNVPIMRQLAPIISQGSWSSPPPGMDQDQFREVHQPLTHPLLCQVDEQHNHIWHTFASDSRSRHQRDITSEVLVVIVQDGVETLFSECDNRALHSRCELALNVCALFR